MIKEFEGLRLNAYICSGNQITIGYGHANSNLSIVTLKQSDSLLLIDIALTEAHLNSKELDVTQSQYDALVSLIFNIGIGNFDRSTLLKTLDGDEFDKYVYSKGKRLKGLIRRRTIEKNLFNSSL